MEYQDFVTAEKNGKILVGIEPAIARRFFTETNYKEAIELTDNNLFLERFSIRLLMILEVVFAILAVILSALSLKWYSLLFIPIFLIFWFKYKLGSSLANQNISGIVFITFFVITSSLYFFKDNLLTVLLCISTPLTFLFSKLIYKASTVFLRNLAINNHKIYGLLLDKGIFIKHI